MKKLFLLVALCLVSVTFVMADEITFSSIAQNNNADVLASANGFSAGPALNVLVSDSAKGLRFPLIATFNASAGPATSFVISTMDVNGTFSAGGTNSVSIVGSHPILEGNMLGGGDLGATYPGGTGSFQGIFDLTFVDPAVLALFGQSLSFDPRASVSITFGQNQVVGSQLEGVFGGGTTTIVVTTIPEPKRLGLAGMGILLLGACTRKWRQSLLSL